MTDAQGTGHVAQSEDQFVREQRLIQDVTKRLQSARDLLELLQRLQELRAILGPHFAHEEAPGGFFDIIRDQPSRLVGRVEQLRQDHLTFLRETDLLMERLRACLAGPVAEILRQGVDLAQRLHEHESRENNLLVDAIYTDSGGDG